MFRGLTFDTQLKVLTGPAEGDADDQDQTILETFEEMYRDSLQALPPAAFPQSKKHGKHSYTVQHGCY